MTGATVAFEYTGKVQSVTLEPGSYKLEVWGAESGQNRNYSYMDKSEKGEKTPLFVYNETTASYYPNGCLLNSSFYLDDSSTKEGNALFPSPSGISCELGHNGNGFAKITPF